MEATPETSPPTQTRIRWGAAFRALVGLAKDNDDTTYVFKIIDALGGDPERKILAAMKQTAIGRQIIEEERSLLEVLSNREHLRTLPEASLGRTYLAFMESEGLTKHDHDIGRANVFEAGYGYLLNIRAQLLESFEPFLHRGHYFSTHVGVRGEEIVPGHSDG